MRLNLLLAALLVGGYAQAQGSSSFQFERPAGTAAATLKLLTPQGKIYQQDFAAGQSVSISTRLANGALLGDGTHRWEVSYAPVVNPDTRARALAARQNGDDQLPPGWPAEVSLRSGLFLIQDGQFQPMLVNESDRDGSVANGKSAGSKSGDATKDQVFADDLIIQGSICTGFDCINNENFGADTLRLKENNLRIHFEDTSTGAFPSTDWRLTANDQASGGASRFSIEDITAATVPFTILAGSASNAIFVGGSGRVGFRTSTPVLDLHVNTNNTPAIRLEQNNSGGFTQQTWDIAGNEANFFVRDVTGGSRLPLRIRPGAPTSSVDISADGDVGLGIASPSAALHVRRGADPASEPWLLVDRLEDGNPNTEDRRLELDKDGNLFVSGSITQLSSRTSKTGFVALAGDEVLTRLSSLPIWTWNYLSADDGDRHIGPVAEDFYAAFGFGRSERSLAPGDVAGVALAATKALQEEVSKRDQRISELEARLLRLEAALEKVEDRSRAQR